MNSSLHTQSTNPESPAPSKGLRGWLLLLTIVAIIVFGLMLSPGTHP